MIGKMDSAQIKREKGNLLPLSIHCAQRHSPKVRVEFRELGNVVCNLGVGMTSYDDKVHSL